VSLKSILNGACQLLTEVTFQRVPRSRQSRQMKNGALHERSAGLLGRMLIQRHDIGPGVGQEGADGRHQPGPIAAAQQQPAHILDRHRPSTDLGIPATDRRVDIISVPTIATSLNR